MTEQQAREVAAKIVLDRGLLCDDLREAIAAALLAAVENEQERWQEAIYELCCGEIVKVPERSQRAIDGAGCDSGDPLDVTLTEIRMLSISWQDETDSLLAAAKVPDGCVRLPDGRDVRVLGELPMTSDQCVIGIGGLVWATLRRDSMRCGYIDYWVMGNYSECLPPNNYEFHFHHLENCGGPLLHEVVCPINLGECYSTRAAAESARAAGKEKADA